MSDAPQSTGSKTGSKTGKQTGLPYRYAGVDIDAGNELIRRIGPAAKAAIPALTAVQDERIVGMYAKAAIGKITGQ